MSAGYNQFGRYVEQDDPPRRGVREISIWIWWKATNYGRELRCVTANRDHLRQLPIDHATDKVTEHQIEVPTND